MRIRGCNVRVLNYIASGILFIHVMLWIQDYKIQFLMDK